MNKPFIKNILNVIIAIPIAAIVFLIFLKLKFSVSEMKLTVIILLTLVMIGTFWVQYFKIPKNERNFWTVLNSLLGEEDINDEDKKLEFQQDNFCSFGSKESSEHKRQSKNNK